MPAALAAVALAVALGGPAGLAQQTGPATGPASLAAPGGYNPLAPQMAPAAVPAPAPSASDAFEGLPETEGVELVYGLCGACHSIRLVTQQRVTAERWDYLLDWMVKEQNMPELPREERATVLAYLNRHFSSQR